jgi:hypothetical protein
LHPYTAAVLPRLGPLIGDSSPRVRAALADLLLAVKSVRSLHFYDVVGRCKLTLSRPR